jgi:abortive infection bacteriophage resistance protein
VKYSKPHLPYDQQLKLLMSRGLGCDDQRAAISALKSVGYYRLSAYTYVLRAPGLPTAGGSRPPRSDQFVDGARLEDALSLCRFDHHLRLCLLDALQQIEIGMRVQIGYQLGKTDPFGHLNRTSLDLVACAQPASQGKATPNRVGKDAYEDWSEEFRKLQNTARNEEFVKHFTTRYDSTMPVWVATEFMTFGCLTYLYQLLGSREAKKIAGNLGVRDQRILYKWLKALNVLRNHCAHNARIWNRTTIYPPQKPPVNLTPERLHHLRAADPHRVYFLAAICAHLVITLSPDSNWPRQFATRVGKFPAVHGMTLENTMGFVDGWAGLPLWNYDPKTS